MKLAIIGAGNVGGALGQAWARAGHRIAYGLKDPEDLRHDAALRAAGTSTAAPVADAVQDGRNHRSGGAVGGRT